MIERINGYVARRFGGAGTTRGSLVRIHVWIVVFLILVSALAQTHDMTIAERRVFGTAQNVARSLDDQRAFAPSAYGPKNFHIAWIMGSEGEIFPNILTIKNVAAYVRNVLPQINGRRVVVDIYYLPAARLADSYFSLLDAIQAKPDMLVVSLNPVWVLNPVATHQWTQLDARAAVELAGKPKEWPIAASLLSPSDLMWGLANSRLTVIKERNYWSKQLHDLVDDIGPLDRKRLAKAAAKLKPSLADRLQSDMPLEFWFKYRLHLPRDSKLGASADAMSPGRWAQWIAESNAGENAFNKTLLRAIGSELKSSHLPSYVYLAQVNSDWLDTIPAFAHAVGGVESQLEGLRGSFTAPNIRYQPKTATQFVPGISFVTDDAVHMQSASNFAPYLATELCRLEAQVGQGARCKPQREGTNHG